jgi:hypothetical protein
MVAAFDKKGSVLPMNLNGFAKTSTEFLSDECEGIVLRGHARATYRRSAAAAAANH